MIQFQVLGGLGVSHGGRDYTPTPPKVRQVLALLLLRSNRVVHVDTIISELWDDEPPASALTTTRTYIYQLRKIFAAEGLAAPAGDLLVTTPQGYMLKLHRYQVDDTVFGMHVELGRAHIDGSRFVKASDTLRRALDMWTGTPLANVSWGRSLRVHVVHLEELRIAAIKLYVQAEFALGHHRYLIGHLRALVAEYPFNEWLHGRLIEALGHVGRRGEALMAYQALRTTLANELGLDPSAELQRIQQQVLRT
jgi:SARP family transcriptional regulator, regulator of embCAB operon